MRNLALFILFLIGLFYVRRALRGGLGQGGRKPAGDAPEGAPATPRSEVQDFEQMVACAHCGLHVPESEAVRGGGSVYCCDEHRRLGPRR
ncbi:MAG: hypothetical protein JNL99_12865 [Zoogloea sp.]|nr:hypothetical protein [Zoogloea sp.]